LRSDRKKVWYFVESGDTIIVEMSRAVELIGLAVYLERIDGESEFFAEMWELWASCRKWWLARNVLRVLGEIKVRHFLDCLCHDCDGAVGREDYKAYQIA
jgi:hypothetical protein